MTSVAACGGEDVPVTSEQSTQVLEQQRLDVRSAMTELMRSAAETLEGESAGASGQFRGCTSSGPETFEDFRYRATGRIDAGSGTARPYLDALTPVLQDADFDAGEVGERPGGRTLTSTREGIEASFSELPGQGDYVLVTVSGPCVDVPKRDSGRWLSRSDGDPIG
ncbi:hypothetical protein GCM10027020_17160 [Nocardioides salsibiostraticola]